MKKVSPGEVILSEGYMGLPAIFVIKDGQVEISITRDDIRIVLGTLGKGQFFGEDVLVSSEPRRYTARALSYCELQVVEAAAVKVAMEGIPSFLRHMLRSLIQAAMKKDEQLAGHENIQRQSDILSCAHILALMGAADAPARAARREREGEPNLPVADVIRRIRDVTGHSRRHVAATLKRMAMLNLISLNNGSVSLDANADGVVSAAQTLSFHPTAIVTRAQELAKHNFDGRLQGELELIGLDDLETLTGVERNQLLKKLAAAEIAEDVFNFSRTEVLRFISEKGRDYFAKRQNRGQLESVDDLLYVDKRILFDVLNGVDEFDLAKLFQQISDKELLTKLYGCLSKSKREEIEKIVAQSDGGDPYEAEQVEQTVLEAVKALRRPPGASAQAAEPASPY
ncbi:cyclic nucleotide-binding domain-containing protein [Azohydromonas lata]|uniref:Cyclic nucleotide-binding domain-containing protein n=1 Tax=Azohydromonas lata TaxID=45677 RepID=A0ABU5IAK9_9BURK|nr:cyclic nucleotide-binding domain-containing protein [Azohydromonas lata]MDZ5456136.1 cyclic nucleotide-binding domain-containing protein [Azohydromonas lata]